MTNTTCTGSNTRGDWNPYNAKGRPMTMVTCTGCGREWRRQGSSSAVSVIVPAHPSPKGA
jgi:hypothetical protein